MFSLTFTTMSRPLWLPEHCVPPSRVIPFPHMVSESTAPAEHPELGGALTFASPENLILQCTQNLGAIVRIAHSLSEDQILTLLADLLSFKMQRLEPLQLQIERHKSFLSDLSARQAKKRRRRQKRCKEDVKLSA